jgi:hypothetical protein
VTELETQYVQRVLKLYFNGDLDQKNSAKALKVVSQIIDRAARSCEFSALAGLERTVQAAF